MNEASFALDRLMIIADALKAGTPCPADAARWFLEGVDGWLSDDIRLEDALGLRPEVGQCRPVTARRRMDRNAAIVRAAFFYAEKSTLQTAKRLHTALERYRSSRWRFDNKTNCPYPQESPAGALWIVLKLSGEESLSARTIRAILADSSEF